MKLIAVNIGVHVPVCIGVHCWQQSWHKFLLLLTVAAFVFGLISNCNKSQCNAYRDYDLAVPTCLHVKCDTGQHWLDYRHSKQGE